MSTWRKASLAVGLAAFAVFFLLALSLGVALATGLYVDHGQNLPGGFTVTGLVALLGMLVAGAMWGADMLVSRS